MMRKGWVFLLATLVVILSIPLEAYAQRVWADVKVILERLPLDKRQKLADFAQKLEAYINDYEWTEDEYGGEIHISIQMFLSDISTNFEDRYQGRFLITNNSDIQYFDKRWRFNYQPTDILRHEEGRFSPLTSLIDFYIYLILGGEFDKLGKFKGTPFYEKARNISYQANFSQFPEGWDLRRDLVEKLLSDSNKPFREAVDLYFLGLAYLEEDPEITQKYCYKAIEKLREVLEADPRHELAKQFIKGHYIEIVDIFKDSPDRSIFEIMAELDPDRAAIYKEHLQK